MSTTDDLRNISTTDLLPEEAMVGCDTAWKWAQYLVSAVIIFSILVPLGAYVLVLYQRLHLKKLREKRPSPKCLHCATVTYYVTHCVYFTALLFTRIFYCIGSDAYSVFANLITLSYVLHWLFVIAIYLARLQFVFRDTSLRITRRYICNFVCLSISFVVFAVIIQISRQAFYSWTLLVIGNVVSFLSAGMISLVLSLMFIRKLFQLNLEKRVLNEATDVTVAATKMQSRIVRLMTRYTVMAIVSGASTFLFVVWMCAMIANTENEWMIIVANTLNILDMMVDFVVMSFAFSFADTMYNRCCGTCHSGMERCCARITHNQRDVQLAKVASMETIEVVPDSSGPKSTLAVMKTASPQSTDEELTINSTVVTDTQSAATSQETDNSV